MGSQYGVICKDCGKKSMVSKGGGFTFHLLHCNKCGDEKEISFDELGDIQIRYEKRFNTEVEKEAETLTEKEYQKLVEQFAGKCKCGGKYKFNAPPRCFHCKSKNIEFDHDNPGLMYD